MYKGNLMCFKDTQKLYSTNDKLKDAVSNSIAKQHIEVSKPDEYKEPVVLPRRYGKEKLTVVVSGKRSLSAAYQYVKQGDKVCVLNFASPVQPGGGVLNVSTAQEECLCRVSTLYPCLLEYQKEFYNKHIEDIRSGKMDASYNDDCIYTPDVVVFKTDDSEPSLSKNWYNVDIVTCVAPNLRKHPSNRHNAGGGLNPVHLSQKEILGIHMQRGRKILTIAAKNGCDVVILGAFGCGAYCNPANIVAEAYRRILKEFTGVFKTVEFAVYCTNRYKENNKTFKNVLSRVV